MIFLFIFTSPFYPENKDISKKLNKKTEKGTPPESPLNGGIK